MCPAGDDPSPRCPNRRTRSNSSPRCCGNPPSVNGPHRIAFDSSDSGHATPPPAQPLTPSPWMPLAARLRTRSATHARRVEQGQVSPPPTQCGGKPRGGSSSWRPAHRRTGRVTTLLAHRRPATAPTLRCSHSAGHRGGNARSPSKTTPVKSAARTATLVAPPCRNRQRAAIAAWKQASPRPSRPAPRSRYGRTAAPRDAGVQCEFLVASRRGVVPTDPARPGSQHRSMTAARSSRRSLVVSVWNRTGSPATGQQWEWGVTDG